MKINIYTIFKEYFTPYLSFGIIKRAIKNNLIQISIHDIRDYSLDRHKNVDDYPYGGGAGMLMMFEPIYNSLKNHKGRLINMSARGKKLDNTIIDELLKEKEIDILCSHYEGVDQRIIEYFKPLEISIGDYILSGGEISGFVLLDAILRKIDGVIDSDSLVEESHNNYLLEYDQYTRPNEILKMKVPDILLSGNHEEIRKYRLLNSIKNTLKNRPDLIEKGLKKKVYTEEIIKIIKEVRKEQK